MLKRFLSNVSVRVGERFDNGQVERPAATRTAAPAPMEPLLPPPAANDDPMIVVYDEVRRELQRAGYLD
jgi:hypothetical protein